VTRYSFPLILTLAFLLAACGGGGMGNMNMSGSASSGNSPAGTNPAGAAGLSKTVDGVKIDVKLNPATLDSKTNTVTDVTLTNAQNQPITDGRVVVTLTSTGMSMAPVIAQAEAKGNGLYSATLKPTGHGGGHTLTVDVQSQGKAYQAKFDGINVK
jgi:hypothetical protein